jgi:hypothetical protein
MQLLLDLPTRGGKGRLRRIIISSCRARAALFPLLPAIAGNPQTVAKGHDSLQKVKQALRSGAQFTRLLDMMSLTVVACPRVS